MKLPKLILPLLIALLLLLILLFVPFRTALVFYKENTSTVEALLPIKQGETFQIIFKHSIHLTDVVEKYKITSDLNIQQYEFVYEEFGIGMPSNAEEGETFEYIDGKYYIKNMSNIFPTMNIRNGKTVSEHRLVWGTEENEEAHMVWFNDYFEPGAWFTVKVERLSLWDYLKGVKIHE
ncbi:DUF1850 domain-containing protein [Oceanobacillus bengalensis]|uniref:DUF1850 domain-containing protein n=1 Tax=Oceanobacillus bengalensis TaxID=1435466 RepID=A0A494Z0P6_9BACI|nr:DUF1850 domain-containing protein [Oceanobacillus bengalensis]RKQ15858.1 DUF1850 domain-containing protein [Oceanobacillus bengalensis]